MTTLKFCQALFHSLSQKERQIILIAMVVICVSLFSLFLKHYFESTEMIPMPGGIYREGIVGGPTLINPVLASANEADQVLISLIFESLLKPDGKGGLRPGLASEYEILDEGQRWKVYLRKDVFWHDGQKFSADDVIFTIERILDPEVKSPLIFQWQGVNVQKIDDYTIIFSLPYPYALFARNLANLRIIPRHIWQSSPAPNFRLSDYNFQPIGTGPYYFQKFKKDLNGFIRSYFLKANEKYFDGRPYIDEIRFHFYPNEAEALRAFLGRRIDGLGNISTQNLLDLSRRFNLFRVKIPRSYAVFLNPEVSEIFEEKALRQAFSIAVSKNRFIKEVFSGQAIPLNTPFLEGMIGFNEKFQKSFFSLEKAKEILEENGWKDENGDGVREKEISEEETSFRMELSVNLQVPQSPFLMQTASILKSQWEKIGAKVEIEISDPTTLKENYLGPRGYEALLFGEILSFDPDPFNFWHSSQRFDPGLNIALYENKKVDKLLEEARQSLDKETRQKNYEEFQEYLLEDMPAIFLYSPYYLYALDKKIKGVRIEKLDLPYQRFFDVKNWYIKMVRAKKKI